MVWRHTGAATLVEAAAELVQAYWPREQFFNYAWDKIIMYCYSRADVGKLGDLLRCPTYTSESRTEEEKAEILSGWLSRREQLVIVATSALGIGFDYLLRKAVAEEQVEFTGPAEVLRQDWVRDEVLEAYERDLEVMSGSYQGKGGGARGAEEGGQGVDRAVPSLLEVLLAAGDMPGGRPRARGGGQGVARRQRMHLGKLRGSCSTRGDGLLPQAEVVHVEAAASVVALGHHSIQALRPVLPVLVGVQVVRAADLVVDDGAEAELVAELAVQPLVSPEEGLAVQQLAAVLAACYEALGGVGPQGKVGALEVAAPLLPHALWGQLPGCGHRGRGPGALSSDDVAVLVELILALEGAVDEVAAALA
ncbi:hypothetical protein V492_00585 [Pseudogymnoascus sp. VKM F-4246]|nr:hypothetical protein V492_00585 [Pseudogymnoascus sp. VKM F-4246]